MERDWYLVQAYLAKDDNKKAIELLNAIAMNPKHEWQPQAQMLLQQKK